MLEHSEVLSHIYFGMQTDIVKYFVVVCGALVASAIACKRDVLVLPQSESL